MKNITHEEQHGIWEKEHLSPYVLKQMDSEDPSGGVITFYEWFSGKKQSASSKGLEMCCGKGRSVIWLAKQKIKMTGFDFSENAIKEAKRRSKLAGVDSNAHFMVQDATKRWAFDSNTFDFVIDCFATTDIESDEGRNFARDEAIRVLKPGGYLLVYTLSTENEFHSEMMKISPTSQSNSFLHPTTGKFEKTWDVKELEQFYSKLSLVELRRVPKTSTFFGKEYRESNIWMVLKK